MELPILTMYRLDVLGANPVEHLMLNRAQGPKPVLRKHLADCMPFLADEMWELLIRNKREVKEFGGLSKGAIGLLQDILAEHGLALDMFPELREVLCKIARTQSIDLAIWYLKSGSRTFGKLETAQLRAAGLSPNPTVEELFVNPPPYHPRLTEEQVTFLRKPLEGAFAKSTQMNMWLGYTHCVTVFDLALLLPHMVDDDTHVVRALRTELEAVLGPLPLQLTVDDLGRVRAEGSERSYHV